MGDNRFETVDAHFLRVFDGLFSDKQILRYHHSMLNANFSPNQSSTAETKKFREWEASFDEQDFSEHWLAHACERKLGEMPETSDRAYKLRRVFCNLYSFGSYTFSHYDSGESRHEREEISFLYLVNHEWDPEWGGEMIFFDDNDEPMICVGMKPGRLLAFDGAFVHRAGVPTRYCNDHRLTFALRYVPERRN